MKLSRFGASRTEVTRGGEKVPLLDSTRKERVFIVVGSGMGLKEGLTVMTTPSSGLGWDQVICWDFNKTIDDFI